METEIIYYKKRPKKKPNKKRTPSRQKLHRELRRVFNEFIRKRDDHCLMGDMYGGCKGYLTAGHVVPKEDSQAVEFLEDNVFGQCSGHNLAHKYRRSRYYNWFVKTHGPNGALRLAEITKIASQLAKALSIPQLQEKIDHYKKLL